jgi:hypothetical protein
MRSLRQAGAWRSKSSNTRSASGLVSGDCVLITPHLTTPSRAVSRPGGASKSGQVHLARIIKSFEYAAVDAGRIPDHILKDTELAAHLPAFFRTLSGQKPSREDMEKLLGIIKGTRRS